MQSSVSDMREIAAIREAAVGSVDQQKSVEVMFGAFVDSLREVQVRAFQLFPTDDPFVFLTNARTQRCKGLKHDAQVAGMTESETLQALDKGMLFNGAQ